jgi:hypothetical protein
MHWNLILNIAVVTVESIAVLAGYHGSTVSEATLRLKNDGLRKTSASITLCGHGGERSDPEPKRERTSS